MADAKKSTDGPSPFASEGYDTSLLPDFDTEFIPEEDIEEFAKALSAPDQFTEDLTGTQSSIFITALNDWRPVHQRVRGKRKGASRKRRPTQRGKDETREGFVYNLLRWPLLLSVLGWIIALGALYLITRFYIFMYEQFFTWRGRREHLRRNLQGASNYADWIKAAKELDAHLGNDAWRSSDESYDHGTVRRVKEQMEKARLRAEVIEKGEYQNGAEGHNAADELRSLVEAAVKSNFVGVENPRLYSQTYYGTKDLVQAFTDEVEKSLILLRDTQQLTRDSKRTMFKHLSTNFGRTALCLSGGATFAYYHFGVVKALLDAALLPEVITGTSGGALIAALACTHTDDELKALLVPALAGRIKACADDFPTWARRWWRTGARFDSIDWARKSGWFTRGSMTFREAFERTGRILNVTCIPSDPHSPTILMNYLTAPDCVIWSAVLASAAVPGILNPIVLMMKKGPNSGLAPYSFGHKWKDGSLRTDIPLKALNLHFNVTFSIVSQVNPHINLFFFSSRGSVGRPVTHRRGRGWRGGFLGSAIEQYLKLDLTKWLKVLRHLELLPRPMGQDWSEIWLQRFNGTITIWPKSVPSDFVYILSDPSPQRLARMLHAGQQSTFPTLKFIANRIKIERLIDEGRRNARPLSNASGLRGILSEDDLQQLLEISKKQAASAPVRKNIQPLTTTNLAAPQPYNNALTPRAESPGLRSRIGSLWQRVSGRSSPTAGPHERHSVSNPSLPEHGIDEVISPLRRSSTSIVSELGRQSRVFLDDFDIEDHDDHAGSGTASGTEDSIVEDGDLDQREAVEGRDAVAEF